MADETTAEAAGGDQADHTERARLRDIPVMLFARGVALLVVFSTLLVGLHVYLGRRLITLSQVPEPVATALWAAMWVLFGSIFVGFIGARLFPRIVARIGQWLGFVWMGAFGLLLVSTALSDVILFGLSFAFTVEPYWYAHRAIAVVAVVVPALAYGFWVSSRPVIKRVKIAIEGLDPALEGFRIAQISDVHISEMLDRRFAQQVTDAVNSLNAHLVAVTGDLIDGSVESLRDEVAPLGGLRHARGVLRHRKSRILPWRLSLAGRGSAAGVDGAPQRASGRR